MASYYCDNCGDYVGKGNGEFRSPGYLPPSNAIIYRKGGFMGFMTSHYCFCSDRCKREWIMNNETENDNNKTVQKSPADYSNDTFDQNESFESLDSIRARAQRDYKMSQLNEEDDESSDSVQARNSGMNLGNENRDEENNGKALNGYKRFEYQNGDVYKGNFVNGNKEGEGTYFWSNGARYTGGWVKNNRHGFGTMNYSSNHHKFPDAIYIGEWKDDEFHGKGQLTLNNGDVLNGTWIKGQFKVKNKSENTSISKIEYGSFTDSRDKKKYKTIKIGNQIWMAENLAFDMEWDGWAYDNDEQNIAKYGRLYTWNAATVASPKGWHLPSDEEWKELEMAIGLSRVKANDEGWRGIIEGTKLKSKSGWAEDGNGTDNYGFNALPGGNGLDDDEDYYAMEYLGYWWSSTENEDDSEDAWHRCLQGSNTAIERDISSKKAKYSVRCVKD